MKEPDKLMKIIGELKSPKFKDERQVFLLINEILSIYTDIIKDNRVNRKIRRRIKKVWKHGLPYDLYEQLGLSQGIAGRHIKMIMES